MWIHSLHAYIHIQPDVYVCPFYHLFFMCKHFSFNVLYLLQTMLLSCWLFSPNQTLDKNLLCRLKISNWLLLIYSFFFLKSSNTQFDFNGIFEWHAFQPNLVTEINNRNGCVICISSNHWDCSLILSSMYNNSKCWSASFKQVWISHLFDIKVPAIKMRMEIYYQNNYLISKYS